MDDPRLLRVGVLIKQQRFQEAEKILTELLAEQANGIHLLALLAEVNLKQNKLDKAHSIIDNAIGLSPDTAYLFYVKAGIALQQDQLNLAEKNIEQAIALDPYEAEYPALLSSIKLGRKHFQEALEAANRALHLDAENLLALNTRSTALNKLNRGEESFQTIEKALREDPNNAYTHTNYAWGLLEQGNHKKALEHFKEALANEPNFEYAQAGMLEALKATNPMYRIFLKYAFFMGNLSAKYQWGVIIGFYLAFRGLSSISRNNEHLQPYLVPLMILLALIAFSTWFITPVSNLFLRFNKYGRLLLDKKEKASSNLVALSMSLSLAGLHLYFLVSDARMLTITVYGLAMVLPLGVMFSPSKSKNGLLIYTIVLALIGLLSIVITFSKGVIFNGMTTLFIFAFFIFQWFANYSIIKENK